MSLVDGTDDKLFSELVTVVNVDRIIAVKQMATEMTSFSNKLFCQTRDELQTLCWRINNVSNEDAAPLTMSAPATEILIMIIGRLASTLSLSTGMYQIYNSLLPLNWTEHPNASKVQMLNN